MKKKFMAIIIMMAMLVTFIPANTFAASKSSTKSMTTYTESYKAKDTVYVSDGIKIFKVNTKTGSKKVLVNQPKATNLKLHKGYLYYRVDTCATVADTKLCRVRTDGKCKKTLKYGVDKYAISGKYIYCSYYDDYERYKKIRMKLNGSSKKKTSANIKMKTTQSNSSSYYLYYEETHVGWDEYYEEYTGYFQSYLVTPKKPIFLENVDVWELMYD